jgi:agmatinase
MSTKSFLGAALGEITAGKPAILGCPLDMTSTFKSGSDKAPNAIREASESIETYSPFFDKDLEDLPFVDLGDLDIAGDSVENALAKIENAAAEILRLHGLPLSIGGEHTVTLGIVKAFKRIYPEFVVVHLDAHTDLRDDYEGNPLNHATVIKRVAELIGAQNLVQMGIRSGTRPEFRWMKDNGTLIHWTAGAEKQLLKRLGQKPVYLTLDLDVMDPACFPATGNPEAGGWFYNDMERFLRVLTEVNIVGIDVVELNPALDPSGASTILAAKIIRELLIAAQIGHGPCAS